MKSKSYCRNSNITAASNATKKTQDLKQSSTDKTRLSSTSSHRNDAKHRRSPSVITGTDQTTIATNSVAHVAANNPSVKALVLQQQQREQHETDVARSRNPSFVKYNNLETNTSSVFDNDHDDSEKNFIKIHPSCSPEPSTLLLSSQGQQVVGSYGGVNTPGSNAETILIMAGHHNAVDDDGTNVSEITSDAGYMVVNSGIDLKVLGSTPEIDVITEHIGSLNINEIGASLIHDTLTPSNPTITETSVSKMSMLNCSTTTNTNVITTTEKSEQISPLVPSSLDLLLNPKELSNDVLQACYIRFLQEMEARGLYSITPQNANMSPDKESMINNSNNYNDELSSIIDNCERFSRPNTSQSIEFPINSFSLIGKNLPHDLRKNTKRSKSGGSETAFLPPPVVVNANTNITHCSHSTSSSMSTGRRTPNSPYLQRFSNSIGDSIHQEKLNTSLEPEDIEIRNAFGNLVIGMSPMHHNIHHSSNPYQTSPSNTQQYYSSYSTGGILNSSSGYNNSNTTTSSSPVLYNNFSSPRQNTSASVSANTSTTVSPSAMYLLQRRPLSRGSGVIPPLHDELIELRRNCLSCLPTSYKATSSTSQPNDRYSKNSIKTSQIDLKTPKFKKGSLHGAGPGFGAAALLRYNLSTSSTMENDNTTFLHETSITSSLQNINSPIISHSNSSVNSINLGQSNTSDKLPLQYNLSNTSDDVANNNASSNSFYMNITNDSEDINNRDLVKCAGGFDQLLRSNRGRLYSKELVPDVNSAFDDCSFGSQSLRSVGSNRSASKKKKHVL